MVDTALTLPSGAHSLGEGRSVNRKPWGVMDSWHIGAPRPRTASPDVTEGAALVPSGLWQWASQSAGESDSGQRGGDRVCSFCWECGPGCRARSWREEQGEGKTAQTCNWQLGPSVLHPTPLSGLSVKLHFSWTCGHVLPGVLGTLLPSGFAKPIPLPGFTSSCLLPVQSCPSSQS